MSTSIFARQIEATVYINGLRKEKKRSYGTTVIKMVSKWLTKDE